MTRKERQKELHRLLHGRRVATGYRGSENPANQKQPLTARRMKLVERDQPDAPSAKSRRLRKHRWVPA